MNASIHVLGSSICGFVHAIGDANLDFHLQLLKHLLSWFKNDFFSWVDKPKCGECLVCASSMSFDSLIVHL